MTGFNFQGRLWPSKKNEYIISLKRDLGHKTEHR